MLERVYPDEYARTKEREASTQEERSIGIAFVLESSNGTRPEVSLEEARKACGADKFPVRTATTPDEYYGDSVVEDLEDDSTTPERKYRILRPCNLRPR